eukprot:2055477-Prymnesium_polylepis.1
MSVEGTGWPGVQGPVFAWGFGLGAAAAAWASRTDKPADDLDREHDDERPVSQHVLEAKQRRHLQAHAHTWGTRTGIGARVSGQGDVGIGIGAAAAVW